MQPTLDEIIRLSQKSITATRHYFIYRLPDEEQTFLNTFWPSNQLAYHPLNPMYSMMLESKEQFNYYKLLWLWDGAYSLMHMFKRFSNPPKGDYKILVSAELSYLVPENWYEKTFLYRIHQTGESKSEAHFAYGICNSLSLPWPILKHDWEEHKRRWNKKKKIYIGMWKRVDPVTRVYEEDPMDLELSSMLPELAEQKPNFIANYEEIKKLLQGPMPNLIHLDLYYQGLACCIVEHSWRVNNLEVAPRGKYTGLKTEAFAEWTLSSKHKITLHSPEIKHNDFERINDELDLVLRNEDKPFVTRSLLLETAKERLTFI